MNVTRRRFFGLCAGLTGAVAGPGFWIPSAHAQAPFAQPPLPYDTAALAPVISPRTVELHYGRHHAGYYRNLNALVEDTELAAMPLEEIVAVTRGNDDQQAVFNNAGQAWNHNIYWAQMTPGGASAPSGRLAAAIDAAFGNFDAFKDAFTTSAGRVFGSGWCWLVQTDAGLGILGTSNAENPVGRDVTTLMGIDVWEHAYYLDYENRRSEHVRAVLDSLVNWDYVADQMA